MYEGLKKVIEKRGGISGGILVKESEMGEGSALNLTELIEEEEETVMVSGIKYDERDYKRGGYKKNWCSLYEHIIHTRHEPFVEEMLLRYKGYVNSLHKKFELLKRKPRNQRRQGQS